MHLSKLSLLCVVCFRELFPIFTFWFIQSRSPFGSMFAIRFVDVVAT